MSPDDLHARAAELRNVITPLGVALAEAGEVFERLRAFAAELDLDAHADALLDAARAEQPSQEAIERTLGAALRGSAEYDVRFYRIDEEDADPSMHNGRLALIDATDVCVEYKCRAELRTAAGALAGIAFEDGTVQMKGGAP